VKNRLDSFGFTDKRLAAFQALGLKVYAAGRDSRFWRFEISLLWLSLSL